MRGSPSLVGRGIANPMSAMTRGFKSLSPRFKIGDIVREEDFALSHQGIKVSILAQICKAKELSQFFQVSSKMQKL